MSLLHLLKEGLIQAPTMSSQSASSFLLLVSVAFGSLPMVNENTIAVFLFLQLIWCLLLWVRSVRVVGSQSTRRTLEADARAAALTWMDVLRFAAVGWALKWLACFEIGAQLCELYCGVIALRTLLKPLGYAVLYVYGGPAVATRFAGFDPSSLFEWAAPGQRTSPATGPAWKQHGHTSKKATSAAKRLSSLAPSAAGSDTKNNNNRCVVLDEGPHFNTTVRGCILSMDE